MLLDKIYVHSLHFTDPEFNSFIRLLSDAAHVYALAGNTSGLAFSQAVATSLHVAGGTADQQAVLAKIIALNIQQKQLARQRAESN